MIQFKNFKNYYYKLQKNILKVNNNYKNYNKIKINKVIYIPHKF